MLLYCQVAELLNAPHIITHIMFQEDKHVFNVFRILINSEKIYINITAFRVLAVFRQLSTHGQKYDPESLYEPI